MQGEEIRSFGDSVQRLLERERLLPPRAGGARLGSPERAALWRRFGELGWLALPLPEAHGGLGGSFAIVATLLKLFGRAQLSTPYVPAVLVAGGLLAEAGGHGAQHLGRLAAGEWLPVVAVGVSAGSPDPMRLENVALRKGDGFCVSGFTLAVPFGAAADHILVPARTAGEQGGRQGISLFLVPRDASGLSLVRSYEMPDGTPAADLRLHDALLGPDALVGPADGGLSLLEAALARGALGVAGELLGGMWASFEQTRQHLLLRRQFDRPLAEFQALQHRLADLYMRCELAQSALLGAAEALDRGRWAAVAAATYLVGTYARELGKEAIQLHGGMGMTDELPIGRYFVRAVVGAQLYGDARHHLARFRAASQEDTQA